MKATVIEKFDGVPDGSIDVKTFKPGDVITGQLAKAMVAAGLAKQGAKASPVEEAVASGKKSSGASSEDQGTATADEDGEDDEGEEVDDELDLGADDDGDVMDEGGEDAKPAGGRRGPKSKAK